MVSGYSLVMQQNRYVNIRKYTIKYLNMISLLEWITENGYVQYKDEKWYKPSEHPRVFLKHEELIALYETR